MKRQLYFPLFIFLSIIASISHLRADDTISTLPIADAMKNNVLILQDSNITRLMLDKIQGIEREQIQVQGFRVQLFSSSAPQTAKVEAFKVEKRVIELDLDIPTYVLYNPPFWKVRVGDFKTQDEALSLKEELVRLLPDLQGDIYVVRDQIEVLK